MLKEDQIKRIEEHIKSYCETFNNNGYDSDTDSAVDDICNFLDDAIKEFD